MIPAELSYAIEQIASLPGIGKKSASRIIFHLLRQPSEKINHLTGSILKLKEHLSYCDTCGGIKTRNKECQICDNHSRDKTSICVVEQPSDIFIIENTGEYRGLYHVLNGVLSPLDGINPEDLRFEELKYRILKNEQTIEIIVATNPSIEGNATAYYIAQLFENKPDIKVTRIASGLAAGSLLEYADSHTISHSLRARLPVK
ncbi:MAG: recombination mediator RecR [Spirochaetia bacterium]|nr:recombination mediator RecR [Spirochaetia bacterium]